MKIASLFDKLKNKFVKNEEETKSFSVPHPPQQTEKNSLMLARQKREALDKIVEGGESRKRSLDLFKQRKRPRSFFLGTVLLCIKLVFILVFMLGAGLLGAVIGLAEAYMETTPTLNIQKISNQAVNSYMYDANGNLVTTFVGTENREWARLSEIPVILQEAVIATEDVRFNYHNGVDVKRLFGAVANNFMNESVQGGSTITQQLIKNRLLTLEQTYKRKIQEAYLSVQLEEEYSKDDILEAYLNTIPLGGMNYGVKAAANDYFGKKLNELTLREVATIAGITQSPYRYDPRRAYHGSGDKQALRDRTDLVLKRMYTANFITKEEFERALKDDITVLEKSAVKSMYKYPYFVEYCVTDVINSMLFMRNMQDTRENRNAIENELRTSGYSIMMTVDPSIQTIVEDTLANYENYPKMEIEKDSVVIEQNPDGSVTEVIQPQAAAVVLDHTRGEIKAIVGGRYAPSVLKSKNLASESNMPVGSSIKPIAVYGPAIDMGYGPATPIANIPVPIQGWDTPKGYPATSASSYGIISLRSAVVGSRNIAAARTLMEFVTIEKSKQYLLELGVKEGVIQETGAGLALGSSGIPPLQMAGAFGAIANEGVYQTPLTFTKVLDKDGKVILDAEDVRERRQVFKPATAYLLIDVLTDAVRSGTGTKAKIEGMTVAGKTGTNQDNKGVSFAGITPYYTATVWIGHVNYKPLSNKIAASSTAAPLWQAFMEKILSGKPDKPILPEPAEYYDIAKATVCGVSGKKVTNACTDDMGSHKTFTDLFAPHNLPQEDCDMHKNLRICNYTYRAANVGCYDVTEYHVVVPPEGSPYLNYPQINGEFDIYTMAELQRIFESENAYAYSSNEELFCYLHTTPYYSEPEDTDVDEQ